MPIDTSGLKFAKPEPRRRVKARATRHESAVKKEVRSQVSARDGYCRLVNVFEGWPCTGPSEWCHLWETRAKTMRQDPTRRHTTAGTMMGCRRHHNMIDGRVYPRIYPTARTTRGADGPMDFKVGDTVYREPEAL